MAWVPKAVGIGFAAAMLAAGCGGSDGSNSAGPGTLPQPTNAQLAAAGLAKLPVAPDADRVDLAAPTFSDPTRVTNPLFPIGDLRSAVLSGRVEGKPFHTETTLLPHTRLIEWSEGEQVEALVSQYVAYLDGRIEEVALDYYAQADDESVWYFGEDVFNYDEDGAVGDTEGTWLAGRDGPPAMIMPGDPQVGDVFRTENIPAIAFEEVTVKTVGKTVDGPSGPVEGAMVGEELHDDGATSDKVFAPGYGEFFTRDRGEVEAMALAVPADALSGPTPPELGALTRAADDALDAARAGDWAGAAAGERAAEESWAAYRRDETSRRIAGEMERSLTSLSGSIEARDRTAAGTAAIDVAQSTLDLELRYRSPAAIDQGRFGLWARQALVDASAGDLGGVRGDAATLGWIRDRFAGSVDPVELTRIDAALAALAEAVADEDLAAASDAANQLISSSSSS